MKYNEYNLLKIKKDLSIRHRNSFPSYFSNWKINVVQFSSNGVGIQIFWLDTFLSACFFDQPLFLSSCFMLQNQPYQALKIRLRYPNREQLPPDPHQSTPLFILRLSSRVSYWAPRYYSKGCRPLLSRLLVVENNVIFVVVGKMSI